MTGFRGKESFLLTKGVPLVQGGYPVVPIKRGEKFPQGLKNWQSVKAGEQDIVNWAKGKFTGGGAGILTGNVIGVDIDLWHEDLVTKMIDWCHGNIGAAPIRIGNRPKALLVYRTGKPFKKCISNAFRDEFNQLNRIEILGVGQQFVSYAIHPDTDEPYLWLSEDEGGEGELVDLAYDQLAEITLDQIESMFAYFTLLVDENWTAAGDQSLGRVVEYDQVDISNIMLGGESPKGEQGEVSENDDRSVRGENEVSVDRRGRHDVLGDGVPAVIGGSGRGDHRAGSTVADGDNGPVEKSAEELLGSDTNKGRLNITEAQVSKAISVLDADESYELWVKVGMALYHQYEGGFDGFNLWDEWSKEGSEGKYSDSETKKKWHSFKADTQTNPVTMASILKLSRKLSGTGGTSEDADQVTLDDFIERFVYVTDGNRVCDLNMEPHISLMELREFQNHTLKFQHEVPAPTERDPDKTKWEPVWKSWLMNPSRLDARGSKYLPDAGRVVKSDGVNYINEYHIPKWERVDSTSSEGFKKILEHFQYQLADEEERKWLLDWFAHLVQRPAQRCLVTPLLVATAHGTGRGWFGSLLRTMLGTHNVSQARFKDLTGERDFNGFLDKTLVCEIGEVREAGREKYEISDKVRDVLTEKELRVNVKFGKDSTQPVFTRFFLQSNHPDALALTEEDRRIQVLTGPTEVRESDYYDSLYMVLNKEPEGVKAVSEFYWWLQRRDISDFDFKRSSITFGRRRMITNARSELEQAFLCFITESGVLAATQELAVQCVLTAGGWSEFNIEDMKGFRNQVQKLLKEHFISLKDLGGVERFRWNNSYQRVWIRTGEAGSDLAQNSDAITKNLDQCQIYMESPH